MDFLTFENRPPKYGSNKYINHMKLLKKSICDHLLRQASEQQDM